ncbi:MAG: conditioned medium factor [Ardenticatenaceae bacterium]|nr:MAG: conditioned medium factor [Ardenticatenaceae bacterium]
MQKRQLAFLMALLVALFLVTGGLAAPSAADELEAVFTKQVAGPGSDVLDGRSQLPNPANLGVRSRTAMIPVTFSQAADGSWQWQDSLLVDSRSEMSFMVLGPDAAQWEMSLQTPAGEAMRLGQGIDQAGVVQRTGEIGLEQQSFSGDIYTFAQPERGAWQMTVRTAVAPSTTDTPNGYLLLSNDSPYQIYAHLSSYSLWTNHQIGLVAYAYDAAQDSGASAPAAAANIIRQAQMQLIAPNGRTTRLILFDDGRHGDGAANDGVFGALMTPRQTGQYTAQVTMRGQTPDGAPVLRTTEHIFPVVEQTVSLADGPVTATADGLNRLRFNLNVATTAAVDQVQLYAELWGADVNGQMAPVTWIGGLAAPTADGIPVSVDGRWLALANASAPFELRNVRLQDVETHIPLTQLESIALNIPESVSRGVAETAVTEITEEMLMGERPTAVTANQPAPNAPGGVLMLVHGYCSGGVWPTGDFTSDVTFQDYNQNRSHDQFANLIGSYGSQFPSFGIVAHSQGGAASLHLYTYYWSGLDYSSGSRLIQSVGTPYQGTALAGNLALLGQLFGAGCGTNWDLTYDGAALWLSGIPSWARSRVYYHTTSFKDVWWRYDYCNIATDLFLSDPDDGVVEKWSGQLSGGNNLGHKTGWCHTSGMRDPAQTQDHSRNANMNTYANR